MLKSLGLCSVILLAEFWASSCFAEPKKSAGLVVYGSPIETALQNLPASASIRTQQQIEDLGVDHLQQQLLALANLNTGGGTKRPRFFQIRGIGELEQYEGAPNSSVAVIVDDVDLTGSAAALTLFDVKQLELHRGPQATRFGSSALAGALNLESKEPTDELDGQAEWSVGNDDLVAAGVAVGAGVNQELSVRLSAWGHRQDGFRDNVFLGRDDTNERQEFSGRGQLEFKVSENNRFILTLLNSELDNGYDAFSIFNGFETQSDRPGEDQEHLRLGAVRGYFGASKDLQLVSVTSIYESENEYSFDGDWGNNPFWAPYDPYDYFSDTTRDRTAFAQQFRLTNVGKLAGMENRSMLGLYFQNLEEATSINELADNIVYDQIDSDYRADTYAIFGSSERTISEQVKFLSGLRFEQRDTSYSDSKLANFYPDDSMWGGNLTIQYNDSRTDLYYLTLAKGFKGGGFNTSPGISAERKNYDPETLWNLELGKRFSKLSGNLTGSVAAFYNWRRDQQIKLAEQDDPSDPLAFTYITDNAARGESQGVELELGYQLTERFNLTGTGSLLLSRITTSEDSLEQLDGRDQSHAPGWQYFSQADYKLNEHLTAIVGVSGRAGFYFDDSHDQRSEPYHLLHAGLRYDANDWSLSIWGRNLTDEEYAIRGFYFGNEPPDFQNKEYVQLGDPRTFGITLNCYF